MFTSYFAKLHCVNTPLSISGRAPVFYRGPEYKVLAPKYSFWNAWKNGEIDNDGYVREYNRLVLSQLDPAETYKHLTETYGADVTLLCYEKPGDFCHRRLVADWFHSALGVSVPELTRPTAITVGVVEDEFEHNSPLFKPANNLRKRKIII